MLALMRKHARNWLMKAILGIIILVFIFYFGSMRGGKETEKIASVDGIKITRSEYLREYRQLMDLYRQRYGMSLSDEVLGMLNLKQRVYDALIDRAVILAKADELNLDVSDGEVQQAIFSQPHFQRNGVFDPDIYERALRFQGITPEDFEAQQRKALKIEKLERLIKESVKVAEFETYDFYRVQNQALKIAYVGIDPLDFADEPSPSDEELREYLQENAEQFRIPRQVKLRYIRFPASSYEDPSSVTDDMIENFYYDNRDDFKKPGEDDEPDTFLPITEVRDRIVARIAETRALDEAYREAKTAHDFIYQHENFEEFASEHDLVIDETDLFSRDNLPEELAAVENLDQWAFDLAVEEMTPVLSDDRAHYLFVLAEERPERLPELDETRVTVEESWRFQESLKMASKKADDTLEQLRSGETTIEALAEKEKNLNVGTTDFFVPGDEIPEIGYSGELAEALYTLSEKNPLADDVFFVDGKFYLIALEELEPIDEKDWEEQKDTVTAALLNAKKEQFFQSWLAETKASMLASERITISIGLENL
ncbi:MAG TPA: hypothetical protein ENN35_08835 [Deltaproteobacteria bacterium]|nr:hypothetical protein [Deltaproteobacteria bacterium]